MPVCDIEFLMRLCQYKVCAPKLNSNWMETNQKANFETNQIVEYAKNISKSSQKVDDINRSIQE